MSRKNLEGLLGAMLDESETQQQAAEVEEMERRAKAKAARDAREAQAEAKEARVAASFDDIGELTGLSHEDLRRVLGAAAPDDLIVVLATAEDVLQRRILSNLGPESVAWVRENLAHMDRVTDAERDGARTKMLKCAKRLLEEGKITAPESESVGQAEAPRDEEKELRELLTDLVRIAEQAGPEALTELAQSAGEPLLRDGLALVVGGAKGAPLQEKLAAQRAALEARYAKRIAWMSEALVAISEGEEADAFRARLFQD